MKKICFFVGSMEQGGGTEHMTQIVANALAKSNYEIFVISRRCLNGKTFYPLDANICHYILDDRGNRGLKSIITSIFKLYCFVKRNHIGIIINSDVSLGLFSIPLKVCLHKVKLVFWDHFNVNYNVENKRMLLLRKLALKYGQAYVTLTPEDANDIKKLVENSCTIRNIPNICSYEISEESYNIQSKRILSAGNMLYVKGFDMAIAAAKIVFQKHKDWQWDIYGDGPELEQLKNSVKELRLEENIHFWGRTKNIADAYKRAAFFVLPSRSEGFGLVIVEAQSFHLPVVAYDVPYGPRNLIMHGKNGFLVEPENIEALAKAILEVIESEETRRNFSINTVIKHDMFSEKNVIEKWIQLLGEL